VAFFTLLEQKVSGYFHVRKGPNRIGFSGIQPFIDPVIFPTMGQYFPLVSNY
jgi:NADH:ubiquinone oxidoreductase subunit H